MLHRTLLALCVGVFSLSAAAQDTLPPAVLAALKAADVPAEALSAAAIPLSHRAPPWRHRAMDPVQPGSSMKLVTSIVALDRLGPNQRGSTELRSAAPVVGDTLQGDLVLKGGADVELDVARFWALLSELRQRGIVHIEGDLLVDRTLFRPVRADVGLPPFDESPEFYYNVIPDALYLGGNLLPLELSATADGVRAITLPALAGLTVDSRMQPVDAPCSDWDKHWKPAQVARDEGRTLITLNGAFPRDCTQRTGLQLIDRLELEERLFRTLWEGLGGSWGGRAREAAGPLASALLARHVARPWGEVLRHQNKTSDNAEARLLYLLLGVSGMATNAQASTAELAAREVRAWFTENRIDATGLVLDNGSGLSRSERISPWQMVSMLKVAWSGRNAPDFIATLPTVGVDGTMRNRLKASPATGWARLKTGTLKNVVALAGYVNDSRGRPWAVAMMVNHDKAGQARPVLDTLVDAFARSTPSRFLRPAGAVGPLGEGP
jgi:D-alanyl-D-alanine carboxypeptidase/D-alanyl-D-alanine-endopeptidase (penicillin-binding protein 4)